VTLEVARVVNVGRILSKESPLRDL
jgi:hypothetical protein